tara:strand:- start:324 stop:482 length:159 start_codon:yes stop_codon:yes gene_type:complete
MNKKENGLHIREGYKKYSLRDGVNFWAKSDKDAELYRKKINEKLDKLKNLNK